MWETYEWYMDRLYDHKVREFLESHVIRSSALNGIEQKWAHAASVATIAAATKLSEKRALGCLKRLKRKKEVLQDRGYWKLATS